MLSYNSLQKWMKRFRTDFRRLLGGRGLVLAAVLFILLGSLVASTSNVSNIVAEHRPVLVSGYYLQNDSIYLMNYLAYQDGQPVSGARISLYFSQQSLLKTGESTVTSSSGYANYSLFFRSTFLSSYENCPVEKYSVRCASGTFTGTSYPVAISSPNPGIGISQIFPVHGSSTYYFLIVNFHKDALNSRIDTEFFSTPNGDYSKEYNFTEPVQIISIPVSQLGCIQGNLNYKTNSYSEYSTQFSPSSSILAFNDFSFNPSAAILFLVTPFAGIVLGYWVLGKQVSDRTIDSVLVRPVTRREIIAARYLVGAAGLSFIFLLCLLMVYLVQALKSGYYTNPLPFLLYAIISVAESTVFMSLMFMMSMLKTGKSMLSVAGIFLVLGLAFLQQVAKASFLPHYSINGSMVIESGLLATSYAVISLANPINVVSSLLPMVYYAEFPLSASPGLLNSILGQSQLIIGPYFFYASIVSVATWMVMPLGISLRLWRRKE